MLKGYYNSTGVPILCNTSLNDKGEPIINTFERGIEYAFEKRIVIIYLNGYRLQLDLEKTVDLKYINPYKVFFRDRRIEVGLKKMNPYGLSKGELEFYYNTKELNDLNLTNERDVKVIKRLYKNKIGKYIEDIFSGGVGI